jgi:ornithine cyclodeaminase/alanine dehydrogenase-like protein (mu-crystallin family)
MKDGTVERVQRIDEGRRRCRAPSRLLAVNVTLFDSTGLAIQDLAIAKAAYAKTGALDGLQQIEL